MINEKLKVAAQFLSRCSSCMMNLEKLICDITCHPKQTSFIEVFSTATSNTTNSNNKSIKFYFLFYHNHLAYLHYYRIVCKRHQCLCYTKIFG